MRILQRNRFINYRVEPQDVDFTLRATLASLSSSILNTAGLDAYGKGFGVDVLQCRQPFVGAVADAVEIDRRPEQYTGYTVATWISDYGRVLSTRNFTLTDAAGREFGRAVTQWAMIDLTTRAAVDLSWVGREHEDAVVSRAAAGSHAAQDPLGGAHAVLRTPGRLPRHRLQPPCQYDALY